MPYWEFLTSLCYPRNDAVVFNVIWVVSLNVDSEPVKRALDRLLRGRVHHSWVLWAVVWYPADEGDFAPAKPIR